MTTTPPIRFTPGEIEILRTPSTMPTHAWAMRHFRLVSGPSSGRPFNPDRVPYAKGIMDMWDKPYVRKLFFCAPSQMAKTTIAHCCLASSIWRSPADAAIVMPGETTAKRMFRDRIIPHFRQSPKLRKMLSSDRHAEQFTELRFRGGASFYAMWAGSEPSISSTSIKYMGIDEEDAYGDKIGATNAEQRTLSYLYDYKIFRFSKVRGEATDSTIWRDMTGQSQALYRYKAKCPHCGHEQIMEFERIRVPEGVRNPSEILYKRLAYYECEECKGHWTDHDRNRAVADGYWHTDSTVVRPEIVGFHLPSWYSPFVSLSKIMADWFEAQGDPVKLLVWHNSHACVPYKAAGIELDEHRIKKMVKKDLEPMMVPREALALTCGIDVQMQGVWYVVRAWARNLESWLIDYGWKSHWDDVTALIKSTYPVFGMDGVAMPIWRTAIDIGGGKIVEGWSKTDEVKYQLKTWRGLPVFGVKGASRTMSEVVRASTIGVNPNLPRKQQSEFLTIYLLDTHRIKSRIMGARLLPGSKTPMWLHNKVGEDYLQQITAEKLVRDGKKLVWDAGNRANHLFDCEVYAQACVDPDWSPSLLSLGEPNYIFPKPSAPPVQHSSRLGGRRVNPFYGR